MGCEEEQSGAGQVQHSAAEQRSRTTTGSSGEARCESTPDSGEEGVQREADAGTGGDGSDNGHDMTVDGMAAPQAAAVTGDVCTGDSTRAARRRKRVGSSGARAVRRFAAFAAGAREEDVVMVGGVHEFAGMKRAMMWWRSGR